ncbi:MAG: GNAT family N-acetyltransferase [Crocinitomicaceae bacterium]
MIQVVPNHTLELTKAIKQRLFELMRHAYAVTEEDIWGKDYDRLEREEYFQLLNSGVFYIALENDQILGSIQVYRKDNETFGFGLLNVDFDHTGKNIGARLIGAAENHAMENGGTTMQLEIIRAEEPVSDFKKWLRKYYEQLGYVFNKTVPFEFIEQDKPEKREDMKTNAVFDILQKSLLA